MTTKGRRGLGVRDSVLLGMLGALMFVLKMALAWLPNIEPVSLLIMVYMVVFGWKGLFCVFVYVGLEYMVWGFGLWSACYLYVWPLLAVLTMVFRRMKSPLGWAVLSGAFGLSFGALCSLVYLVTGGWAAALSWWTMGIPFDLMHCAGNFVAAAVLFAPCKKTLMKLTKQI